MATQSEGMNGIWRDRRAWILRYGYQRKLRVPMIGGSSHGESLAIDIASGDRPQPIIHCPVIAPALVREPDPDARPPAVQVEEYILRETTFPGMTGHFPVYIHEGSHES